MGNEYERLLALMESSEFSNIISEAKTIGEFKEAVGKKGIILTDEKWAELWNGVQSESELSDDELATTSGGMIIGLLKPIIPTCPLPPRFPWDLIRWLKRMR